MSNVKYPRLLPQDSGLRGNLGGLAIYLVILIGGLTVPSYFLFPVGVTYVVFGVLRASGAQSCRPQR